MKRFNITMLLVFIFSFFANATPLLTSFTVVSNYFQNGKIKVYNNGTTTFLVHIGASRAISGSSYENVNMEVVFYVQLGSVQHTLKTVTLTSSHFNQHYLSTYNEDPSGNPVANNLVALDLPQNIELGEVRVKYRYKDSNNVWQPNSTYGYTSFSGSYYKTINVGIPYINITSVYKAETSLIGVDCGFGPAHAAANHMENGVWRLAYDINYTKTNPAIADSDIYWEWIVADEANYPSIGKQFLVYPYGGVKNDFHNGQKKVWVEANDYLDEYQSKVTVRAKSRSTGDVYSSNLVFYFSGVNH